MEEKDHYEKKRTNRDEITQFNEISISLLLPLVSKKCCFILLPWFALSWIWAFNFSIKEIYAGSDSIVPALGSFFLPGLCLGILWNGANSTTAGYSSPKKDKYLISNVNKLYY